SEDNLASCATQHGPFIRTDRVDGSEPNAEAASRPARNGAPTHLVNNGGIIGRRMLVAEMDPAEIDRVPSINLKSVFYCTRASARHPCPVSISPLLRRRDRLADRFGCRLPVGPAGHLYPFVLFEILVALEEMRDRLTGDVGQVHDVVNRRVLGMHAVMRHAD